MNLYIIDPSEIDGVWSSISSMVSDACSYSTEVTAEYIKELCKTPKARLLLCEKENRICGVFCYESLENDTLIQLSTTYNGLSKDEIQELMLLIAEYARKIGAKRIVGVGRKGWKRVAPKLGWIEQPDGSFIYPLERN